MAPAEQPCVLLKEERLDSIYTFSFSFAGAISLVSASCLRTEQRLCKTAHRRDNRAYEPDFQKLLQEQLHWTWTVSAFSLFFRFFYRHWSAIALSDSATNVIILYRNTHLTFCCPGTAFNLTYFSASLIFFSVVVWATSIFLVVTISFGKKFHSRL